jgi:hypothetical protein
MPTCLGAHEKELLIHAESKIVKISKTETSINRSGDASYRRRNLYIRINCIIRNDNYLHPNKEVDFEEFKFGRLHQKHAAVYLKLGTISKFA